MVHFRLVILCVFGAIATAEPIKFDEEEDMGVDEKENRLSKWFMPFLQQFRKVTERYGKKTMKINMYPGGV